MSPPLDEEVPRLRSGRREIVDLVDRMTTEHILLALAVFLIAGVVKGLVGMGLPTITIALTSLVLPLSDTIALVALPTIFTNLWQAAVGGKFRIILRRQWPLIVPLA